MELFLWTDIPPNEIAVFKIILQAQENEDWDPRCQSSDDDKPSESALKIAGLSESGEALFNFTNKA